ncbi:hypothetical protein MKW98_013966 [Papaver atlanticum]|uniref:Uncharacterized protein n=1 Tax=Papaver atlanticum TaxID=357466 RepID=A0AAD4XEI3_9MAGN|nr:hypothetical protein MKW98_013966 [Papaver atlanticum]
MRLDYKRVFDSHGLVSYTAVQWWDQRKLGGVVSQLKSDRDHGSASGIVLAIDIHPSRKHVWEQPDQWGLGTTDASTTDHQMMMMKHRSRTWAWDKFLPSTYNTTITHIAGWDDQGSWKYIWDCTLNRHSSFTKACLCGKMPSPPLLFPCSNFMNLLDDVIIGCVVGGSSGTVSVWDLLWQQQPILLSIRDGILASSEQGEIRLRFWQRLVQFTALTSTSKTHLLVSVHA